MNDEQMKKFQAMTVQERTNLNELDLEIKSLSQQHNEIYRKLRELGAKRDCIQSELANKCILFNGGHSRQRHQVPYGHNEHDYDPCVYCGWDN